MPVLRLPLVRGSREHARYLRSPEWRELRLRRLILQGWQCDTCDFASFDPEDFQLHHRHYRTLGMESIDDVRALDPGCHERLSRKSKRRT